MRECLVTTNALPPYTTSVVAQLFFALSGALS